MEQKISPELIDKLVTDIYSVMIYRELWIWETRKDNKFNIKYKIENFVENITHTKYIILKDIQTEDTYLCTQCKEREIFGWWGYCPMCWVKIQWIK